MKGVKDYLNSTSQIYFLGKPTDRFVAVQSGVISGGIRSFSVEAIDLFDLGIERNLELLINGEVVATSSHTGPNAYLIEFDNINISGDFTIGLRGASENESNNTIAIDNITWKSYQEGDTSIDVITNQAPTVNALVHSK
ncbi:hypothetical protein L3081_20985 [Colwellia sp. MSW7]|uniref:Uncharacterized protein n=1 Tax=Colwellia maritima TaxID=2912588 RepID=A0ABS9X5A2_9GAMM|nr:hypothetical protein [Colwellia maritima]MCI2285406.1 hypothetical protein [Colwellia maritima]